jgi:hypothetical protein
MLRVVFTLDYEIHGNGDGDPYALMVEPTARMMDLFERYGAKLTIMADVAEILKFREFKDQTGEDEYSYEQIAHQLRDAIRRGHDVQLHLHSSYFNSQWKAGRWEQDWSEYNFAGLSLERLDQMVRIGKEFLEQLLKPIRPEYECVVFRAANWAVSPSPNVIRALVQNGIRIDTSVFKYGRREGIVSFDYSKAHSALVPWKVDKDDICLRNDAGELLEIPIYCERRWIGAFLTPNRIYRVLHGRKHQIGNGSMGRNGQTRNNKGMISKWICRLSRRHAWKADFNQCSGRQLIGALRRAACECGDVKQQLYFVLIGHSKLFTHFNEGSLEPFLKWVAANPAEFQFGTFDAFPETCVKQCD